MQLAGAGAGKQSRVIHIGLQYAGIPDNHMHASQHHKADIHYYIAICRRPVWWLVNSPKAAAMALLCCSQSGQRYHHAGMTSSSGCTNTSLAVVLSTIGILLILRCPEAIVAALTDCAAQEDMHAAASSSCVQFSCMTSLCCAHVPLAAACILSGSDLQCGIAGVRSMRAQ